jgi:DNA-binding transcriptional MerR regulator
MAEHLSIGDVLEELRDDHPDVTISKIRFLESQGLISPERTPSGYRKFYGDDIARLRWILEQQAAHFLPLKVIKERLDEMDREGIRPGVEPAVASVAVGQDGVAGVDKPGREHAVHALFESARRAQLDAEAQRQAAIVAAAELDDEADELTPGTTGVSLPRVELARASGLDEPVVAELEAYGLLTPTYEHADRPLFGDEALATARAAAGFMRFGLEVRHLRMYQTFAEREAALFDQVLLGYRQRRNPEAQVQLEQTRRELTTLGRRLRFALLAQTVRRTGG